MKKKTEVEKKDPGTQPRIINGVVVSEEEWRDHYSRRDSSSVK